MRKRNGQQGYNSELEKQDPMLMELTLQWENGKKSNKQTHKEITNSFSD